MYLIDVPLIRYTPPGGCAEVCVLEFDDLGEARWARDQFRLLPYNGTSDTGRRQYEVWTDRLPEGSRLVQLLRRLNADWYGCAILESPFEIYLLVTKRVEVE